MMKICFAGFRQHCPAKLVSVGIFEKLNVGGVRTKKLTWSHKGFILSLAKCNRGSQP